MSGPDPDLARAWARLSPGRRLHGIAAALLPYTPTGEIHWAGFEHHVARTRSAGLDVAVNMDTGFGDLLTPEERDEVIVATRRALGAGVPFYAGAYAEASDPVASYLDSIAGIEVRGGIPVIVQCAALHAASPAETAAVYARVAGATANGAIAFELSPRFAPHGRIWDDETFERLLAIPGLRGAKHSSLDRGLELRRLEVRDRLRPDFRIYTGNDLAIDLVASGSDYLLGLATFAPESFAARDAALEKGELAFLEDNDALQHLGNVAFRDPIPAYKHAAAIFLHMTGGLECDAVHPSAPRRPAADRALLLDCALRLGLIADPARAWQEHVTPYLAGP